MRLPVRPRSQRRGAALLLSVLVLFVLIAIVFQISIATMTDARVGRNDVGLTLIDRSIASAQWDIFELLKIDAEDAAAASDGGGAGGIDPGAAAGAAAGGEAGAEEEPPADSRKDEWGRVQRTEINGIELRILVEAENAKYNVLNVLNPDEEEAEEAFQRVVRIIDTYREGTRDDVPRRQAEDMVREMKEYILERNRTNWPQPTLLTFDEERDGLFLPMSLREFLVLESWEPHLFRSYRDELEDQVHSLDQFLTVLSSLDIAGNVTPQDADGAGTPTPDPAADGSGDEEGSGDEGTGAEGDAGGGGGDQEQGASASPGYGVNLNLAPAAVLKALFDDRDLSPRFWDDVIEYRNLEEEEEDGAEDVEPMYDEFNNEILVRRAFESLDELQEVRAWDDLGVEDQSRVLRLLETESSIFTIYITGRRDMSSGSNMQAFADPAERARLEEQHGGALIRTVRTVVWRREGDDGTEIVTILPWEVVETQPYEIQDYPDEY